MNNPFKGLGERIKIRPGEAMGDGVVLLNEKSRRPVTSEIPPDEDAPRPKVTANLNVLVLCGHELRRQGVKVLDFYPARHRGLR